MADYIEIETFTDEGSRVFNVPGTVQPSGPLAELVIEPTDSTTDKWSLDEVSLPATGQPYYIFTIVDYPTLTLTPGHYNIAIRHATNNRVYAYGYLVIREAAAT